MLKLALSVFSILLFSTIAFSQLTTEYWNNGQKRVEGKVVDGNRDSTWHTWNEEGHLTWTGHYNNGIPAGEWIFYRDSALIEKWVLWESGQLKQWKRYFEFDTTRIYTTIDFPQPVEPETYAKFTQLEQGIYEELFKYLETGVEENIGEMNKGNIAKFLHFGFYGATHDEFLSQYEEREIVWRLDTLRRSKIFSFWDEMELPFVLKYFGEENQVTHRYEYNQPDIDSHSIFVYKEDEPYDLYKKIFYVYKKKRKEQLNFTGPNTYYQKTYYPSGELESEGFFKEGQKHGNWKYYDKDGNQTRKEKYKNGVLK
ncbi:toxin-antitoxin system YwqK family antitoxin [Halocola ammonii]